MVLQYAKEECVCVQELERKIIILNTLFQDTAAAVGLHQYAIDTIQATVDSATQDTSTAFVTLQVAEKQANSSRKVRERARASRRWHLAHSAHGAEEMLHLLDVLDLLHHVDSTHCWYRRRNLHVVPLRSVAVQLHERWWYDAIAPSAARSRSASPSTSCCCGRTL